MNNDSADREPQKGRFGPILKVLMGLGLPSIFGLYYAGKTTLWEAILVLALYESAMFMLGIFGGVFGHLQSRAVSKLSDWVDSKILEKLSGHRRTYNKYLLRHHATLFEKSFGEQHFLDLTNVYVSLSLSHQSMKDVKNELLRKLSSESQSVWQFIQTGENFVIVGPPGSGKTTLMKYLVLTLAKGGQFALNIKRRFVVFIPLVDHYPSIIEKSSYSIDNILDDQANIYIPGNRPSIGWFQGELLSGNGIIVMDGLDEVPESGGRKRISSWVEDQMVRFSECQFIITSRIHGYRSNPITNAILLEINPFNSVQIRDFVQRWYKETVKKSHNNHRIVPKASAVEYANQLINAIFNSKALRDLSVNPLLLTMIATVHYHEKAALPNNRIELYNKIFDIQLGKRDRQKNYSDSIPTQSLRSLSQNKLKILEELAFHLMKNRLTEAPKSQCFSIIARVLKNGDTSDYQSLISELENESGILVEKRALHYGFAHLTFQEYLSSKYLINNSYDVIDLIPDSWWHETLKLFSTQTNASLLIKSCLENAHGSVEILSLALDCSEVAMQIDKDLEIELDKLISEKSSSQSIEDRTMIAEILLRKRIRNLKYRDNEIYFDENLITVGEYEYFYFEELAMGRHRSPDAQLKTNKLAPNHSDPILGIRFEDAVAFCKWLSQKKWVDGNFRLPSVEEAVIFQIGESAESLVAFWTSEKEHYPRNGIDFTDLNQFSEIKRSIEADIANARDSLRTKALIELGILLDGLPNLSKGEINQLKELEASIVKYFHSLEKSSMALNKVGDDLLKLQESIDLSIFRDEANTVFITENKNQIEEVIGELGLMLSRLKIISSENILLFREIASLIQSPGSVNTPRLHQFVARLSKAREKFIFLIDSNAALIGYVIRDDYESPLFFPSMYSRLDRVENFILEMEARIAALMADKKSDFQPIEQKATVLRNSLKAIMVTKHFLPKALKESFGDIGSRLPVYSIERLIQIQDRLLIRELIFGKLNKLGKSTTTQGLLSREIYNSFLELEKCQTEGDKQLINHFSNLLWYWSFDSQLLDILDQAKRYRIKRIRGLDPKEASIDVISIVRDWIADITSNNVQILAGSDFLGSTFLELEAKKAKMSRAQFIIRLLEDLPYGEQEDAIIWLIRSIFDRSRQIIHNFALSTGMSELDSLKHLIQIAKLMLIFLLFEKNSGTKIKGSDETSTLLISLYWELADLQSSIHYNPVFSNAPGIRLVMEDKKPISASN